ncbi:MAG: hypothetical protein WBU92_00845 [Candidatus Dormiibacterota bacterium]
MTPAADVGGGAGPSARHAGLRRLTLAVGLLVLAQIALGMVVNLYVVVPSRHPGSDPAEYFSGSFRSVAWAVAHGPAPLVAHVILGLALGAFALILAVRSVQARAGWPAFTSVLAALLVIGAGFNGASFLDFSGPTLSSLLMALVALGALASYLVGGYLLGAPERR